MTEYKDKIGLMPAYTIDQCARSAARFGLPAPMETAHARETIARDKWERRVSQLPAKIAKLYWEREDTLDHIRQLSGMLDARYVPDRKDKENPWKWVYPTKFGRKAAEGCLVNAFESLEILCWEISRYWEKCEKGKSAKSA